MFYPKLDAGKEYLQKNDTFGGLILNGKVPGNCFCDCENLSSRDYPLMRSRPPRGIWRGSLYDENGKEDGYIENYRYVGKGITAVKNIDGALCICTDRSVLLGGKTVEGAYLDPEVTKRQIVPFGRNIFIAPDGEYIIRSDDGISVVHCNRSMSFDSETEITFSDEYGASVEPEHKGVIPSVDEGKSTTAVLYDEGVMKLYNVTHDSIEFSRELYIKISVYGANELVSPGDTVFVTSSEPSFNEKSFSVFDVNISYLLLRGEIKSSFSAEDLVLERKIPVMDFAVEHNNRIWGCRYGKSINGEFVNEIYASALGDPTSWSCFEGVSTDSYTANLGCSGDFTGAVSLSNDILFFKEEHIIRVSGSTPSDFSVFPFPARGIEKGSHLSAVTLNERVFYKSRTGVMVYDGAIPELISSALGNARYTDAVAGTDGRSYYIAMTDNKGKRSIFVFDTYTGLWHKEGSEHDIRFAVNIEDALCFISHVETDSFLGMERQSYSFILNDITLAPEGRNIFGDDMAKYKYSFRQDVPVRWYGETGNAEGNGSTFRRKVKSIILTVSVARGASLSLSIITDSGSEWKRLCTIDTPTERAVSVPVMIPPCYTYRLRFEGKGDVTVHSVISRSGDCGEVKNYG